MIKFTKRNTTNHYRYTYYLSVYYEQFNMFKLKNFRIKNQYPHLRRVNGESCVEIYKPGEVLV